jgi:putative ABC transport system ATP-binding protein
MTEIIVARNVTKVYETDDVRVEALRGIDLSISPGEMVAIMGPSGCGKTTLMNTFSGIDSVTGGEVIIDGASIHAMPDKERTRYRAQQMGFIFQAFNLLPVLSGVENVELPLLLTGTKQAVARSRALEMLDLVGLADQARKRPSEMSGGQQQRVTVARALVNQPAIVWADEPTGALDSETSLGIMDLLCDLNEREHQTFVLVTHDAGVGARAGRLVRMRDGLVESDEMQRSSNGGR